MLFFQVATGPNGYSFRHKARAFLFLLLTFGLMVFLPLEARSADDAEQKVYQEMHAEVKGTFETLKKGFDDLYEKIATVQHSILNWRSATTKRTQNASIKDINDLLEGEMVAGRDALLASIFDEDFVNKMKEVEEALGVKIGIPDPDKLLRMLGDPSGRKQISDYMYKLSAYERRFAQSGIFDKLNKMKERFGKGSEYIGKVGDMLDFVALFDPSNVDPESPIGSLNAIGSVLTKMKDVTGAIPGFGRLLDFYIDATKQFTEALGELNKKILEARDGSICGQLGVLSNELKALDEHIKGGGCLNYYTDYELQALLKPLQVWTHAENDETFVYDKDHDLSAYLKPALRQQLVGPFRALKTSSQAANSNRATASVFMALARSVTRSEQITTKPECEDYATLFADRQFKLILREVGALDALGAVNAPSGTTFMPASTGNMELMGLCLYDPRMRLVMRNLADRYHSLVAVTIDVYPLDRGQSPDVKAVRIDGISLVFGEGGASMRRVSDYTRIEALVDTRHPVTIEVEADGFKPAIKSPPLSSKRKYATIYLERASLETVPEPAVPETSDETAPDEDKAAGMPPVEQGPVGPAPVGQGATPVSPVPVDRPQPVTPAPQPQTGQQPVDQKNVAQPVQPVTPSVVPVAPTAPDEAGDVPAVGPGTDASGATGAGEAGDVLLPTDPAAAPVPEDAVDTTGGEKDEAVGSGEAETEDTAAGETGEGETATASDSSADNEPAAPGADNPVAMNPLRSRVYLGETMLVSTPYQGEDIPLEGAEDCDPSSTNPFTACKVTIPSTSGASVYIAPADDTEDIVPPTALPTLEYIWQGSEGVTFDPPTSTNGQTNATFERTGEMKIWAQIVRQGRTIAEAEQQTVNVAAPSVSIRFDPASGAKAGSKITATVVTTPMVLDKYWTVRWLDPATANREELNENGSRIRFTGSAGKPIALEALVNVAYYGEEIGSIASSYSLTAGSINVTARSRGPRPQVWDQASGGLVDLPDGQFVDGQEIDLRAEFAGSDAPDDIRWLWTVNAGTSISNEISQTPTVSRSEAGQIEAKVTAKDKDGIEIASGSISLSVSPQPQKPKINAMQAEPEEPAAVPEAKTVKPVAPEPQTVPAQPTAPGTQAAPPPPPPVPPPPEPEPGTSEPKTAAPVQPATPAQPSQPAQPATPTQPAAPTPAPPVVSACALGSPQYNAAVDLWSKGLSMLSGGNLEGGIAALEASLVVCPDPTRQSQFEALRQRIGGAQTAAPVAPSPAVDCSPGGSLYAEAMANWQQGLSFIGGGDQETGVASLEESLGQCPDPQRQAQLDKLKEQLAEIAKQQAAATDDCGPGGEKYAAAQDAWQRGLAMIGSGENGAGVALLEMSLGDCPDPARQAQLETLKERLDIAEETADTVAGDAAPEGQTMTIEDAVKNAAKACEPGGDRYAAAEESWNEGAALLQAGDRAAGLAALQKSVSICGDAERSSKLAEVRTLIQKAEAEEAESQRQTEIDMQKATEDGAPDSGTANGRLSTGQSTRFAGTIPDAPQCTLAFDFANGHVSGTISGVYLGDQISLNFQGSADGNAFRVPLDGYLIDSTGHFGRVEITGTIWGEYADGRFSGGWAAGNNYESDRGTWVASPQ